jgi:pyruvate dehydrogenase E2 component (dihydrolipoamide acetyltransferase)
MARVLDMPKLSPTMEEGVLSTWHKKEGDAIGVDDLLAEVETDKATMEFRAFDKGTLLKILVPAGSEVKLGQPVAIVGNPGEDISSLAAGAPSPAPPAAASPAAAPPAAAPPAAAPPAAAPPAAAPPAAAPPAAAPPAAEPPLDTLAPPAQRRPPQGHVLDRTAYPADDVQAASPRAAGTGRVLASPYVRKVAREMGLDLGGATGSGPGGRLLPADLASLRSAPAPTPLVRVEPAPPPVRASQGDDEVRPLSPMRKTIARRLTESKTTVPHFYLTIDVDAGELVKLRETINAELATASPGDGASQASKVSLNDLLIKACAVALVRVPECNASFSPEAILVHKRVDISVAVAIPDGLVTPVVRAADQKSVVAIAHEVRELAGRARARKLRPEEMTDGTFSISNLGMFGIDAFSAVINPPEGAILAIGQVRDVPVVHEGAIVAGKRLSMTLSCDHRVVDGAIGAAFLAELRRLLEHPLRVLTG